MSKRLGLLEIVCDAPPYGVVQECQRLGFRSPLDVCWLHVSHFFEREGGFLDNFSWMSFFGLHQPKKTTCGCGTPLPLLETHVFSLASGQIVAYRLGQCPRCGTIVWEDVTPNYVD